MELLRHLYDQVGGGSATDAFKLISAALTALRPFDSAATPANQEASRSVSNNLIGCEYVFIFDIHFSCMYVVR